MAPGPIGTREYFVQYRVLKSYAVWPSANQI